MLQDHRGNQLYLGINHTGILTFQGSRKTHHFKWAEVHKINFEGRMFIVHLNYPEVIYIIFTYIKLCWTCMICFHVHILLTISFIQNQPTSNTIATTFFFFGVAISTYLLFDNINYFLYYVYTVSHIFFAFQKKHTVGFKCPSGAACRHVWCCAIEQMLFFTYG